MAENEKSGGAVTLGGGWFYGALIVMLVLIALGLDLFFLTGFISSDDCQYSRAAHYVLNWTPPKVPFTPYFSDLRLGVILPVALFQWLTGENMVVQAYCFSLFHAGLIVVTFLLGRALHNRRAGAIAAGLVACCPMLVLFAGTALPDIPQTFCLTLGLLALLAARRRGAWAGLALCLAGGFLAGLSYTAKETSLIALPVLGLALLAPAGGRRWPRRLADGAALSAGVAALIGLEMLVLHKLYGNWILRPALSQENMGLGYAKSVWPGFFNPIDRYHWFMEGMRACMGLLLPVYLAVIPLYPFLRGRSWTLWSLLVWMGAYMLWGSASWRHYIPQHVQPRYFIPCLPLAAICLAALADGAAGWLGRRRWVTNTRLGRAVAGAALLIVVSAAVFEGLRVSNQLAGTLYSAWVDDEMGRAMDQALVGFSQPVLVCVEDVDPMFTGWPPSQRIQLKPTPVYKRRELAELVGPEGLLLLTRDGQPGAAASFEFWAARRGAAAARGEVDVAAEAQLATFGASELFDAQRIGFYPPGAGRDGGRLGFFLRSLGWRAGNTREVYLNAPKVYLYLVRPNAATARAAYQIQPIFSLAAALADGGAERWVGAGPGVRVEASAGALRATWAPGAPGKSWLSVTGGPLESPPVLPSVYIEYPRVRNPGRQVTFRLRCQASKPAQLTLEAIQYGTRGRIEAAGARKELAKKTENATEKSREFVFSTLLEPGTLFVRLWIGVEAAPGMVLVIEDLKIEQVVM